MTLRPIRPTICAALACLSGCGPGPVELSVQVRPGDRYTLELSIDDTYRTRTGGETPGLTHQELDIQVVLRVDQAPESGVASITARIQAVRYRSTSADGGEAVYDSRDPPRVLALDLVPFATLVAAELRLELDPRGTLRTVGGAEAVRERILATFDSSLRGVEPDARLRSLREHVDKRLGAATFDAWWSLAFGVLPARASEVGDTWTGRLHTNFPFPFTEIRKTTLRAAETSVAELDVESRVVASETGAKVDFGANRITYRVAGERTGTIVVDRASGLTRRADWTQTISGTQEAASGSDEERSTHIELQGTARATLRALPGVD